jgi:uncharacterized protein (DUF1697 family)
VKSKESRSASTAPCIALLRAINLPASKTQIAMSGLRDLLTTLGFDDVRSVLQSGNLLFRSNVPTPANLERQLETEVEKHFGLRTDILVRTVEERDAVIAHNPFRDEAKRDPGRLIVMFLKDAPGAGAVRALQGAIKGPEIVRAKGREAYIVYPIGIGRSRLTNALIDKKLCTRCTGRNWNTVLKLASLAKA